MKYLALIFLLSFSTIGQAAESTWQLKKQGNSGITIHQKNTDSGYPITRGSLEINSSADAIIALQRDSSACRRWLHNCIQSRLVKQSDSSTRLDYTIIKSPLFFANRDLYTSSKLTYDRTTQTALIRISGRENFDKGQPGKVRIKDLQGFWIMKKLSPNKTILTYQIYSDPQLVPSSFLSNHLVESVFHTLRRLALISQEAKYRNARIAELK